MMRGMIGAVMLVFASGVYAQGGYDETMYNNHIDPAKWAYHMSYEMKQINRETGEAVAGGLGSSMAFHGADYASMLMVNQLMGCVWEAYMDALQRYYDSIPDATAVAGPVPPLNRHLAQAVATSGCASQ